MDRRRQTLPGGLPFSYVFVPVVAAAVVLAGLGIVFVIEGSSGSDGSPDPAAGTNNSVGLPAFVLAAPSGVQTAYRFVAARPDVMIWFATAAAR